MAFVNDEKWDLVVQYLPLAEKMAHLYSNSLISYDDMYQEACLAIYNNLSDYKPDCGASLSTFLVDRIRYHYYDLLAVNKFAVFVPLSYCRQAFRLHRLQQKAKISTGEYLSRKEASERLNLSETTVTTLEFLNRTMVRHMVDPLPEKYNNDALENSNYQEKIGQEAFLGSMMSDVDLEEKFITQDFIDYAMRQLDQLSEKRRQVILYRLGFLTGKQEEFKEIARWMGGTFQNAQQIYHDGIQCLKKVVLEKGENR